MVSRKLMAFWAFFAFALLAASGILISFSIMWRAPNLLLNFVVHPSYLTSGLVLGIAFAVTFVIAVGGIVQPNHVTLGLTMLNWALLLDAIGTVAIGTMIWFFTLQERANFHARFASAPTSVRQQLQDHFSCCGYFNSTDLVVNAGFCQDATTAATRPACVSLITGSADYTLNNIFTSVYGFMAVISGLFLMTLCVIFKRVEAERFRKIDLKRGGKGFV